MTTAPDPNDLWVDDRPGVQAARDGLTVRLNALINPLSGRDDVLLTCLWDTPGPNVHPSWDPTRLHVTIHPQSVIGDTDPNCVDPLTRTGRIEHPGIVGLMAHAASHAAHTRWPTGWLTSLDPQVRAGVLLIEELRAERAHTQRRSRDRHYLAAAAAAITEVGAYRPDGATPTMVALWDAATVAALLLGRVDIGILDPVIRDPLTAAVNPLLGDRLEVLTRLWWEGTHLRDGDTEGLAEVAHKWAITLNQPPNGNGGNEDDPGHPGDGGGDPVALNGALRGALHEAETLAQQQIRAAEQPPPQPHVPDPEVVEALNAAAALASDRAAQSGSGVISKEVFNGTHPTPGSVPDLVRFRCPTDVEWGVAHQIGQRLRDAGWRDPVATTVRRGVPPGRLDGREAMLGAAQRCVGVPVTAAPFRGVVRRAVPCPPVTLGIMVDVSGSMRGVAGASGSAAWAFSYAVTRYVHGSAAAVAFGDSVTPLVWPGVSVARVPEFTRFGDWEDFTRGFAALDGVLNLTTGRGVRVLVVVSDGRFRSGQSLGAAGAVARLRRGGGYVVWFTPPGGGLVPVGAVAQSLRPGVGGLDLCGIPDALGAALVRVLSG